MAETPFHREIKTVPLEKATGFEDPASTVLYDDNPDFSDAVPIAREHSNTDAVVVAYVHRLDVGYAWHHSMTEMLGYDLANNQRVMRGGYIAMTAETDGLAKARNEAVKIFLEEKKADWLWWVDTDMGFAPDTIDRLMADADPEERPVVGGLAFSARQQKPDGAGGWRLLPSPTIFDWGEDGDQEGFIVRNNYFPNALQPCDATGSACILIHKSVFLKINEMFGPKGTQWYDRWYNPKMQRLTSEDLSFCMRAQVATGKKIFVDTSIKTTHQKTFWLQEADYFIARTMEEMMPEAPEVPPATEKTAIIVPVLGRPQNAGPFMESLKAVSDGHSSELELVKVYAMVDWWDAESYSAWKDAGAEVRFFQRDDNSKHPPGTFAEKVNLGYQLTDEPWLFLVGDDVRFERGWLDYAQQAARDGAHVIGTNDLHNPRVTSGEHATHLMVRRAYVDERGASWDGPKVVAHEGYRHWYVDDEIVTVAKQRGVWAFAKDSKVEHLHPLWKNAEMDDTYKLGMSFAEQDKALFEKRLAEYAA